MERSQWLALYSKSFEFEAYLRDHMDLMCDPAIIGKIASVYGLYVADYPSYILSHELAQLLNQLTTVPITAETLVMMVRLRGHALSQAWEAVTADA